MDLTHIIQQTREYAVAVTDPPVKGIVHALLLNDAVLGIFEDVADAMAEAASLLSHYGGEWKPVGDRMWMSSLGRTLGISSHDVRPSTRKGLQ